MPCPPFDQSFIGLDSIFWSAVNVNMQMVMLMHTTDIGSSSDIGRNCSRIIAGLPDQPLT